MIKLPKKVAYLTEFPSLQKFSLTAHQPKWQNSYSKMWPIEQLYIELGSEQNLQVCCETLLDTFPSFILIAI